MDHYMSIKMTCSEDAALLKRFVENEMIYEFLASLDIKFHVVRIQIYGKEDLSFLNETLALVHVEEGRRGVMSETPIVENYALMTRKVHM